MAFWSRKHPALGVQSPSTLALLPPMSSPETQEVAPSVLSSPKLIRRVLHQIFSKHPCLIKLKAACTSRQLGMWKRPVQEGGYMSSDGIPNQSCLKPSSLVLNLPSWRLHGFSQMNKPHCHLIRKACPDHPNLHTPSYCPINVTDQHPMGAFPGQIPHPGLNYHVFHLPAVGKL